MSDIFKEAAKQQLRFNSKSGLLNVEDLFIIPLTSSTGKINLEEVAQAAFKEQQDSSVVSFVNASTGNKLATLKLDVVKAVISDRQEANKIKENRKATLSTIALLEEEKQKRELEKHTGSSDEELAKKLAELKAQL